MTDYKKKKRRTIIFLIVASLVASVFIFYAYINNEIRSEWPNCVDEMNTFGNTAEYAIDNSGEKSDKLMKEYMASIRLIASAVRNGSDEIEPVVYDSGFIVRLNDDTADVPESFPHPDDAERIRDAIFHPEVGEKEESGLTYIGDFSDPDSEIIPFFYSHIKDDLYYIEFEKDEEEDENSISAWDEMNAPVHQLAASRGHDYLYVVYDVNDDAGGDDEDAFVYLATGAFNGIKNISDIGLTTKRLQEVVKDVVPTFIKYDNKWYLLQAIDRTYGNSNGAVVLIRDLAELIYRTAEQIIFALLVTIILLTALAIWVLSVYRTIGRRPLTSKEDEAWSPDGIRKKLILLILAGSVIVFASAAYADSLEGLFIQADRARTSLESYFTSMDSSEAEANMYWKNAQKKYNENARLTAKMLDRYPVLRSSEWLKEASDIMDADYITIYDNKGNETLSSSRYRGLELGKDESSATYVFRRLLRGVRVISRHNVTDEVTGLKRDLHGISLIFNSDDDAYGVMLIAVEPQEGNTVAERRDEIISSITSNEGGLVIGVDPKNGEIKYSNYRYLTDYSFADVANKKLKSSFIGNIRIDGEDYYASSEEHDGIVYYYAVKRGALNADTWEYALSCMIAFLLMGTGLFLILMHGYTDEKYLEIKASAVAADEDWADEKPADNIIAAKATTLRKHLFAVFDRDGYPSQRAVSFIKISLLVMIILMLGGLANARTSSDSSSTVIGYILSDSWEHGINQFAITAVILAFCAVFLITELLRGVYAFVEGFLDQKSKTINMLIFNIIRTVLWIAFILQSLSYLGVNARTIFASAGLMGLAITLGAQTMIKDALAGLTVILSDTYHIGEVIEVNGFRGKVTAVGLISTEVTAADGNVRTFKNNNMGDITNYSRNESSATISIAISHDNSFQDVEKIFKRELSAVGASNPKITTGPRYLGVSKIETDAITITITAGCKEDDLYTVQGILNREALRIIKEYGIKMP